MGIGFPESSSCTRACARIDSFFLSLLLCLCLIGDRRESESPYEVGKCESLKARERTRAHRLIHSRAFDEASFVSTALLLRGFLLRASATLVREVLFCSLCMMRVCCRSWKGNWIGVRVPISS